MAFAYIHFNDQLEHGRLLRRFLQQGEESDQNFVDLRNLMIDMRDGADDGEQGAHNNYEELRVRFGFVDVGKSRDAFLELDSAYASSVGAFAARTQLFNRLRG